MKKIIFLSMIFLFITACSSNRITNNNNFYTMYCNKSYNKYEEYLDITYENNIVNTLSYSYIFNNNIKAQEKLENFLIDYNNIEYDITDNEIDIIFKQINIDDYKNIKQYLIKNYKINEDDFSYIEENEILYNLFSNYIKDYSCD